MSKSQTRSRVNDKQERTSSFSFPILEELQAKKGLNCHQADVTELPLLLGNVFLNQFCLFSCLSILSAELGFCLDALTEF